MSKIEKAIVLGCLCVTGGILIQISYGYFYTIGNMAPYMLDYLNYYNMSAKSSSVVWLTSVALSTEAVGMPLGGLVARKTGSRFVILLSCVIHSGSIALTYFAIKWGFGAIIFTYGVLQGFGFGFAYSVIISVAAVWFPARRGLVVGLIVGGFGAGSLIFTPIQTAYINPENIEVDNTTRTFTDPNLLNRIPTACLIMAGILASIQLLGLLLIREKQEKIKNAEANGVTIESECLRPTVDIQLVSGDKLNTAHLENSEKSTKEKKKPVTKRLVNLDPNETVEIPPLEAIRTVDFYLLWFVVCFAVVPITTTSSLYKIVGIRYISDDKFLAGVAMAASLCNAGGRVMWGSICDRLSFKLPMCFMLILWSGLLVSFPHISVFTGVAAKVTYILWVALLFLCLSGVLVFGPTAAEVLFGPKNMAVNYGLIYNSFIAGSMLASVLNNLPILGGGVEYAFGNSGVMCIIALLIALWIADRKAPRSCRSINVLVRLRARLRSNCCSRYTSRNSDGLSGTGRDEYL